MVYLQSVGSSLRQCGAMPLRTISRITTAKGQTTMTMTRLLGAAGFTLSLTLLAAPALAKSSYWYTARSCQFYPSGGHRTPAETAACRQQRAAARETLKYCRDQQRRGGPLLCGPNQDAVWTVRR